MGEISIGDQVSKELIDDLMRNAQSIDFIRGVTHSPVEDKDIVLNDEPALSDNQAKYAVWPKKVKDIKRRGKKHRNDYNHQRFGHKGDPYQTGLFVKTKAEKEYDKTQIDDSLKPDDDNLLSVEDPEVNDEPNWRNYQQAGHTDGDKTVLPEPISNAFIEHTDLEKILLWGDKKIRYPSR